VQPVVTV
jgi:N-acetylmuramoyl-L-alanine amidase